MDLEGLSDHDFETIYGLIERDRPNFDITYDYRGYFPPFTSSEEYFFSKKNKCVWIKIGEHGCCGEPCKDVYCDKHLYMRMGGLMTPLPCLVCGVGVIDFEHVCGPCKIEKEKTQLGHILARQLENNEDWHAKTSGINASGS